MNQSELLVITSNFLKAREKSRVQGSALLVFGFGFHLLKNWSDI